MPNEKSLNSLVLMDKQGLARHLTNLSGIAKIDTCDRCPHECLQDELFPCDGQYLCEDFLKKAEEPENIFKVCCREIPETSDFCSEHCESIRYQEMSKKED